MQHGGHRPGRLTSGIPTRGAGSPTASTSGGGHHTSGHRHAPSSGRRLTGVSATRTASGITASITSSHSMSRIRAIRAHPSRGRIGRAGISGTRGGPDCPTPASSDGVSSSSSATSSPYDASPTPTTARSPRGGPGRHTLDEGPHQAMTT